MRTALIRQSYVKNHKGATKQGDIYATRTGFDENILSLQHQAGGRKATPCLTNNHLTKRRFMNYFIIVNDAQQGPYTIDELRQRHITQETLV